MKRSRKAIKHQSFGHGVLEIFSVHDRGLAGKPPDLVLRKLPGIIALRYEQRSVGQKREADGRRDAIEIAKVLRVQYHHSLRPGQVVIDKDGEQYDVRIVQEITATAPWSMDLSLERRSTHLPREVID